MTAVTGLRVRSCSPDPGSFCHWSCLRMTYCSDSFWLPRTPPARLLFPRFILLFHCFYCLPLRSYCSHYAFNGFAAFSFLPPAHYVLTHRWFRRITVLLLPCCVLPFDFLAAVVYHFTTLHCGLVRSFCPNYVYAFYLVLRNLYTFRFRLPAHLPFLSLHAVHVRFLLHNAGCLTTSPHGLLHCLSALRHILLSQLIRLPERLLY